MKWKLKKSKIEGPNKGKKILCIGNTLDGHIQIAKVCEDEYQLNYLEWGLGGSGNDYYSKEVIKYIFNNKDRKRMYGEYTNYKIPKIEPELINKLKQLDPMEEWGV